LRKNRYLKPTKRFACLPMNHRLPVSDLFLSRLRPLLCLLACLALLHPAAAQTTDTIQTINPEDTVHSAFVKKVKEAGQHDGLRSMATARSNKIEKHQRLLLGQMRKTMQEAKFYLQRGIDTTTISRALTSNQRALELARDGVITHKGSGQTLRNLTVSSIILSELLQENEKHKNQLEDYTSDLSDYRERIDSLSGDSTLYIFPNDSVSLMRYVSKMVLVARDINPTDSLLRQAITNVQDLQNRIDLMSFKLRADADELEHYWKELSDGAFKSEFPPIWQPPTYSRPFSEIVQFSLQKDWLALKYYFRYQKYMFMVLGGLIALAWLFLRSLKNRLREQDKLDPSNGNQLVVKYPLLSAIILVVSIGQFLFHEPPFLVNFIFWGLPAVCLALVFRGFITPYWMRFWVGAVILFLLATTSNLILQASRVERWMLAVLAVIGIAYGIYQLLTHRRYELREKKIVYFILFMVLLETAGLLCNITGLYNAGKTFTTTGYFGMVIAILFLWVARLINEGLSLASSVYQHTDQKLFFINFQRVGQKVPGIFYVFLILGWLVLIARNYYTYRALSATFRIFITEPRTLGDYTFSIQGISVFAVVLASSILLSRIISFFASDDADNRGSGSKVALGSWLLLLQIIVISSGLFLAIAAAGIPLDKITIILGALSVGIGLGLQGLVSNLVSGLILAFEKPVNVGDLIEVNGKMGTMKSIGFRSSVITLIDGAHAIIPNGDLLSNELINWTQGKNIKRIFVMVGVAYETNLDQAINLVQKVLLQAEGVIPYPPPGAFVKNFGDSSVDIEVYFWVGHVRETFATRSHVLMDIHRAFNEAGINIPFPQHDVHVVMPPEKNNTPGPSAPGAS